MEGGDVPADAYDYASSLPGRVLTRYQSLFISNCIQ